MKTNKKNIVVKIDDHEDDEHYYEQFEPSYAEVEDKDND